jgi:hypothetical protein
VLSWAVLLACPLLRAQSTFGTVLDTVTEAEFSVPIARRTVAKVTARVPLIDTENGVIADSENSEQITRLPLNYRATDGLARAGGGRCIAPTIRGEAGPG